MDLSHVLDKLQRKMAHDCLMEAVTGMIEAEALGAVVRESLKRGVKLPIILADDVLMSNISLDAMTTMIPEGHKYEAMREEATIGVVKRLNKRTEILLPILESLGL